MKKYLTILILFFSFTASAQIIYTPMSAGGYQMKYLKVDSGFALPFRDTTIGRGVDRPGLMVINYADSLPYYYNGRFWKPVYVDSTGVIELINNKVDSVTVNGNNLFYWVAGLGYGAQLNKLDSIHVSADSIFTCIAGNCTFQYLTTAGTGTVTSIMAGFGLTGDTITTTGTIAVDTSVFHTSNWNNATYAPIVHFHSASDIISGTLPIARGGTGLSGIGGAGQSLRVATSGSSLEYYTPPDVSGKINYTDSNSIYVTPSQLRTKVDTSYKDTLEATGVVHINEITPTHHQIGVNLSTDTTFSNASNDSVSSSLAVKSALKADSTVLQNSISLKQNIITNLGDTSKYAKSGVGSSNYLQKVVGVNLLGNSSIKDSAGVRMTPDTVKGIGGGNGLILNQVWTTTSSSPVLFQANATAANGGVLIDLQYNGISKFKLLSGGNLSVGNTITSAGGFIGQKLVSSGGSSTAISSFLSNVSFNPITTGNAFGYQNTDKFVDTVGNATYTAFDFSGSIYQGLFGTATGTTRGLFIHPSLTNPHDWRSIEFNNNVGKGIYQTGSAPNSFAGKTGFYSDTLKAPTASVEVAPTGTGAGGGAFKIDGGLKLITPEGGAIENDTTGGNYHLLWTNKAGVRLQLDKQIDTVTNSTALINYPGAPNLVYLTDTLQGGLFYYSTITNTVNDGTIFNATGRGSGYWLRVYDKTKGINVDWFGSRDEVAIRKALSLAGTNGIINFTPNKLYIQKGRITTRGQNQTFNGNNAILQRANDSIVTLTAISLITDSTITVSSVPPNWSTANGYVQLFTDTTDFSSSTLLPISSIVGNVIKFSIPVGGLYSPNGSHTQITQWGVGTKAHLTYNQIEDDGTATTMNFSVYHLTFDGNKTNNNDNHSWRINTTIELHGIESRATIDHCNFINIPNENIMGHGFHVTDNYAKNLNGSFVHLSATITAIPASIPSFIDGNKTDSTNLIDQTVTNHSEGVITYSNTSGYVTITNNRFYNGGDAVFGVIQSGNGSNGGVRDMTIQGNYAENFNKIFYNTSFSDPTGIDHKQGHIFIQGNTFNKCGTTDWTSFQTNIDKSDTIMIGNNMLVGGTVWTIPVQSSDAGQRYILNNSTSTAQGGSVNVTGTIKGSNIITITTGTAAPTTTPAKIGDEFLDTTNKKFYKAFGTSSSADWVIMN